MGFNGIWIPDHLLNATQPRAGVLECWTALSALAAVTERSSIGPLVISTCFRHPPLLAKQAATLAAASRGRLRLGLGSGGFSYEETCRQFGYPRLRTNERVAHCRETVRCLRSLTCEDPASFKGRFAQADGVRIHPRTTLPIPIIIAARRPKMLALAAAEADGWNCPLPQEFTAALKLIELAGRPRETLQCSVFAITVAGRDEDDAARLLRTAGPTAHMFGKVEEHHLYGGPQQVAARIRELASAGAGEITMDLRGAAPLEALDLIAEEVRPLL